MNDFSALSVSFSGELLKKILPSKKLANKRGFMKGVIEGHDEEVDPAIQKRLEEFLKAKVGKNIELVYEKNPGITAGHRVTVGDLQLDATLENQLNKFKQDIISSRNIRG